MLAGSYPVMARVVAQEWRAKGAVRHIGVEDAAAYGAAPRPWVEMAHDTARFMAQRSGYPGMLP